MGKNEKNKKSGCGSILGIIVLIAVISGLFSGGKDDSENESTTEYQTTQEFDDTIAEKSFRECISEYLDEESVNDVMKILIDDLGFSETDLEFDAKIGEAEIYSIYLDGENFKMVALDKEYRIWNDTKVLYEDETVKMTKQDIKDTEIEIGDDAVYYSFAKEIVEECLKDPSSAQFPSLSFSGEVAMQKNKDLVVVQSYVTAKNSFGAKQKVQFIVEFQIVDMDNYLYNPIYINLGGDTSGEYVDINEY